MRVLCDGDACGCKGGEIVQLTPKEQQAHDAFNDLLDQGYGIDAAVDRLEGRYPYRRVMRAFWLWLRDETLVSLRAKGVLP
jgi:hypothetical protein